MNDMLRAAAAAPTGTEPSAAGAAAPGALEENALPTRRERAR
jgi:hypothetical protein